MNFCVTTRSLRPSVIASIYRFSTATPEIYEQNERDLIDESDAVKAKEALLETKRNISRLSSAHHNLINGKRPYDEPKIIAHMTVKYNRKLYGKYGEASGINPSLCWPTKQDIKERQEYESVAFPYTIQQMMNMAAEKRAEEQRRIEERDNEVAAKYEKLAQWKKELQDRITKKAKEAQSAKDKKERLVEEVRRHFGFTLDPRDERFQEMLAKREKEQKKAEKMARKEAKEKMMIAKLQQKNVEISDKS